ncbi:copper resistance CopC family protein [Bacillus suaedaesalsae]|uniref:Copper resistance protein CopC n=1 Tax=Bacillus suaedaesalsae TaxID=2810349 RepID=A0ABS2DHU4_9BACI|nr:copper resistance protein CopC [Bacillus suaedaesalsae]MBM6617971.1 copper resistance protein CopC [Bacillus suaedaesalsae]
MLKKSFLLTALMLVTVFSIQVQAHTKLESSKPNNGEIVVGSLDTFLLTFATKIEQTSSFEVFKIDGSSVEITNIQIEENKMTGTVEEPLPSGEYKVTWNIIGADGHPINGEYVFAVVAEEGTPQTEEPKEEQKEQAPTVENEEPVKEKVSEIESPLFVIPVIVVLVSAIGIGFLVWILRRK